LEAVELKGKQKENVKINIKFSKSEGISTVWDEIMVKWQQQWHNEAKGRHLYYIENRVDVSRDNGMRIRITRIRMVHINHRY